MFAIKFYKVYFNYLNFTIFSFALLISCSHSKIETYGGYYSLKDFSEIEWVEAKSNMKVYCNYIIKTGATGYAMLKLPENNVITLYKGKKIFYPQKLIIQPNDYFLNNPSDNPGDTTNCEATILKVEGDVKVSKDPDIYNFRKDYKDPSLFK